MEIILNYHAGVAAHICKGASLKLMRLEADLMVEILLILKSKGIVALPIHDGIIVSVSHR